MKNAGKACNNRLYRHIRTFEKIIKNYFVICIKSEMYMQRPIQEVDGSFCVEKEKKNIYAMKLSLRSL